MAIKLDLDKNGKPIAYQEASLPTVYLDTWAYDLFSLDDKLSEDFIKILNKKKGTLLISVFTLYEICKPKDNNRFNLILKMIEQLDQAFIDTNPINVIKRENFARFNNQKNFISPACPPDILKAFIEDHPPFKPINIIHGFKKIRETPSAIKDLQEKLNFEKELMPSVLKNQNDPRCFEEAMKRYKSRKLNNRKLFPHTTDLYQQLKDFITTNKGMKMPNKEWIDVSHAIVPSAYADFVLLDKRWQSFINQSYLSPPTIASVYSKRELDDFFKDLQDFDSSKKENILKSLIQDKYSELKAGMMNPLLERKDNVRK